ncbi:hypothetical protein HYDPIDRAFT_119036 [Hydnomerulius pinastri MD-312]|uniref:3-keto-steroid reductase n=1 Tax=Hydnomerulius pinastri MD-312 TaxID=994086 RepID=A0A0C9W8B5_9AGAM|nr:hypothetical protein HYDPIDRAFT_119036 [Hydnomerulius pinastri MD-312]
MSFTDPTIIVTGANSGIGFAICHRILIQLCSASVPPDALLTSDTPKKSSRASRSPFAPCGGLILILACRNIDSANEARTRLLSLLAAQVDLARNKNAEKQLEHAERFQKNVKIETYTLDLSSISSTLAFARWVVQTHDYVSHLICNAAVAPFAGLNHLGAIKQFTFQPSKATVTPDYLYERTGEKSVDGLGLVWQTNFFGHYVLYRMLPDLFSKYADKSGVRSRVIWLSTLAASGEGYDADDFQLVKHTHPYEASKYEIEIIAAHLNSIVLSPRADDDDAKFKSRCWHLVVQPGVVATTLDKVNSKGFLAAMRASTLFTARCFGSKNHPSSPYKAAVSASHAVLTELPQETSARPEGPPSGVAFETWGPCKINSRAPMFRKESVSSSEFRGGWNKEEAEKAAALQEKLDMLYASVVKQGAGES